MTADKRHSKILEPITYIREESDRNGIRAVIEFKKSTDKGIVDKILKYLYKKTELQSNLSFNMVAISDGKPMTLNLKNIISSYVEHQQEVVTRRTAKELSIAKKRHHIVEGFIKAIDIMDEIIATIRALKTKSDSENNIIEKFGFSKEQAQSIVELMLYRLSGLKIEAFEKEYRILTKKTNKLQKILSNDKELFKVIKKELSKIKDKDGFNFGHDFDKNLTLYSANNCVKVLDIDDLKEQNRAGRGKKLMQIAIDDYIIKVQ